MAKKAPVTKHNITEDIRNVDPLDVSKRAISTQYEEEQEVKHKKHYKSTNVGPVLSMRARILAMSLFPNIYNKKSLEGMIGPE